MIFSSQGRLLFQPEPSSTSNAPPQGIGMAVIGMAVISPQVELLLFFSDDDMNFLNVSIILKFHILTPLIRNIF